MRAPYPPFRRPPALVDSAVGQRSRPCPLPCRRDLAVAPVDQPPQGRPEGELALPLSPRLAELELDKL